MQSEYTLIVRATDNGIGSLSDTARVSVKVKDVNEPPILEGSLKATIDENKCGGGHPAKDTCTVSWILGNVDALDYEDNRDPSLSVTYHLAEHPLFDMSSSGELLIKAGKSLDYETQNKHEVSFDREVFISSILFYCLLYNHSFSTNPNRITNCFQLFSLLQLYNYIAPASLF